LKNGKTIKSIPVSDGSHTLFGVRATEQEYRTSYRIYKNFETIEKYTKLKDEFSEKNQTNKHVTNNLSTCIHNVDLKEWNGQ